VLATYHFVSKKARYSAHRKYREEQDNAFKSTEKTYEQKKTSLTSSMVEGTIASKYL